MTTYEGNVCHYCKFPGPTHEKQDGCVAALCAEIERLRAASEWQPIETAPKDGTEVLLRVEKRAGVRGCMVVGHFMAGGHCIEDHPPIDRGWYFWNGCMFDMASKPLGWRPLPEPPK